MTENEFPYQAGSVEVENLISTVLKRKFWNTAFLMPRMI